MIVPGPFVCSNVHLQVLSQSSNILATANATMHGDHGELLLTWSVTYLYRADMNSTFEVRNAVVANGTSLKACRQFDGPLLVGTHVCVGNATTQGPRSMDFRSFNGTWKLGGREMERYSTGHARSDLVLSLDVANGCTPVAVLRDDLIMLVSDFNGSSSLPNSTFGVPAGCAAPGPRLRGHAEAEAGGPLPRLESLLANLWRYAPVLGAE